ncbi:MAG TPA: hypothetical protein VNZ22_00775 [Bacillota bacterium]|nr:hypothetical protein [Bacillota bacterium]
MVKRFLFGVALSGMIFLAKADDAVPDLKIPVWYKTVDLRGSFGYKDNVLLSPTAPKASPFWDSGLDFILYRLPTHGWQFNLFLTGDDVRYFNAVGVENEQSLIVAAQLAKDWGNHWKSTLGTLYSYQNQVIDTSTTETTNAVTQVLGHGIGGRAMVHRDFEKNWAEVELALTRQYYARPLDDLWQEGPRFILGHGYGHGSDVTLSYQIMQVQYDTRPQIDLNGAPIPHTGLAFTPQTLEVALQHNWDAKQHWRTVTRLGLEVNQDNGPGFFDYNFYRASQKLGYRAKTWAADGQVRVGYYDFPLQPVSGTDASKRYKTLWSVSLHGEKNLTKSLKLFANFVHDESLSNLGGDNYQANTVSGGVDWQF